MASGTEANGRRLRPAILGAGGLAVLGFIVATVATNLALLAGERPVTLVPLDMIGGGLLVIVIVRGVMVVLLAAAVRKWRLQSFAAFLAGTGLFWVVVGVWQWWLMLART